MTMVRIVVAVAALMLFVKCARTFGFRKTLNWAALIVISVFPFTLAARFALPFLRGLWPLFSIETRIVTVSALGVGAFVAVKEKGLGDVLRWAFSLAAFGCFVVLALVLALVLFAAAHGAK